MKTTKPKPEADELPITTVMEKTAPVEEIAVPPAPPPLPAISHQMQAFLDKSFNAFPGRWYYHLDRHADELDAQLVSRGLIEKGEFESKGRKLIRYRSKPAEDAPPSLEV